MTSNIPHLPRKATIISGLLISIFLSGCSDNDDDSSQREFNIKVTNLTNNQPFSPLTGLIHDASLKQFELGEPASLALEKLAESGDNSDFVGKEVFEDSASGNGILAPGNSETITLSSMNNSLNFSLLTMPVNTNDGFIGIDGVDLSSMEKNDAMIVFARVYDAGTENNNELAEDIPGLSGDGFNAERDDRNIVTMHSGVVSQDDGLMTSSLNASHRFDNPAAKVVITRVK